MKRWRIFFSGHVQGVGFRYTCRQLSGRYQISGWVKNLPNGSVEMIAEGKTRLLEQYVADICEATHGRVAGTEIARSAATGEFSGLEIRH